MDTNVNASRRRSILGASRARSGITAQCEFGPAPVAPVVEPAPVAASPVEVPPVAGPSLRDQLIAVQIEHWGLTRGKGAIVATDRCACFVCHAAGAALIGRAVLAKGAPVRIGLARYQAALCVECKVDGRRAGQPVAAPVVPAPAPAMAAWGKRGKPSRDAMRKPTAIAAK